MSRVMVQFNFPGVDKKKYDEAWEECRKAGHKNPKGLLHHVGSIHGDNLHVVDVWETEEAFHEFGKVLMPILSKVGVPPAEPKITNVIYEQSNATGEYNTK